MRWTRRVITTFRASSRLAWRRCRRCALSPPRMWVKISFSMEAGWTFRLLILEALYEIYMKLSKTKSFLNFALKFLSVRVAVWLEYKLISQHLFRVTIPSRAQRPCWALARTTASTLTSTPSAGWFPKHWRRRFCSAKKKVVKPFLKMHIAMYIHYIIVLSAIKIIQKCREFINF